MIQILSDYNKAVTTNNPSTSSKVDNVVVTGGSGFVGKYLQEELRRAWPDTTVVSWDLPEIDITNPKTYEEKLRAIQPDWIVHLAAIASVPAALQHPEKTFEVNTEGTRKLIESIQSQSPGTRMLFISTSDIYGGRAKEYSAPIPELELQDTMPTNPYAESKRDAEEIIEKMFSASCIRVRPFPHIGPGQGLGFVSSDFASQIAAIEAGTQEPVLKVGNLSAKRDFTDVRDVVRAYRLLMEHGVLGEVYHVASSIGTEIQSVVDTLLASSRVPITVTQDKDRMRPADIPVLVGDATKLKDATDWKPTISLEDSLVDALTWWRNQQKNS